MGSNRICSEEWKEMFSLIDTDKDEMVDVHGDYLISNAVVT